MAGIRETTRIVPRPEINIIRCAYDFFVQKWNVPAERTSKFFYCYYSYTPDAAEISANGKTCTLGPDRFVIIPPDLTHQLKQHVPFKHMFMHFIASSPYTKLDEIISIDAKPFLSYLKLAEDPQKHNLALYTLLFALLLEIPSEKVAGAVIKDPQIEKAIQIIRKSPADQPSLELLARQTNMSVSSLSHRFKKATGLTPAQYALQFRLEYALIQLSDFDGPDIETIAELCGFSSRYHLSKQFKKQYGMAPGQMRRYLVKEKSIF